LIQPLRWVALTRTRLLVAINVAAVLMLALAPTVSRYIRFESTSPTADMLLITAWMFVLLIVSVLEGVLVGDLVFRHNWRERVILGRDAPIEELDDGADPELLHQATKSRLFPFAVLVVVFALFNGMLVNMASGRFLDYYGEVGWYHTAMRSEEPALRIDALRQIAEVQRPILRDLVVGNQEVDGLVTTAAVRDPSADVRLEALWTLAEVARRMSRSVDILNADNAPKDRWEYGMAVALRDEVAPLGRRIFETSKGEEQIASARLLGSLRDLEAIPLLARAVRAEDTAPDVRAQVLLALGEMSDFEALDPLLWAVEHLEGEQRSLTLALWGIGETFKYYAPDERVALPAVVDRAQATVARALRELSRVNQCVATEALLKMADVRTGPAVFALFEAPDSTFTCPSEELTEHDGRVKALSTAEPIRIKLLRVVARIVVGNDEALRWLEDQAGKDAYAADVEAELDNVFSLAQRSVR
jgi:hypothetical protein